MKKGDVVQCSYFRWKLYLHKNGTWWADGRSNSIDLGRKSLMTDEISEARRILIELDLKMAVKTGLADPDSDVSGIGRPLLLEDGRRRFEGRLSGPSVTKGKAPSTIKRYRTVLDKFGSFAKERGTRTWNAISTELVRLYASDLDSKGYAPKTIYLELSVVKQIVKDLKRHGDLPKSHRVIDLPLGEPEVNSTYCYTPQDVIDIRKLCETDERLDWLFDLTTLLSHTGMRIGETVQLQSSDIRDTRDGMFIEIRDDRGSKNSRGRTTKSKKTRCVPVHTELRPILERRRVDRGQHLFRGPRGGKIKPDTVRNVLIRDVLKPLTKDRPVVDGEKSLRDGRLHSFRHFFCSECANDGVPIQTLMEWLGHADSDMVRHYYSLSDEFSQKAINRLKFGEEKPDTEKDGGDNSEDDAAGRRTDD